jgi:ribonucleoside-diphosphate reductase beta chain
MPPTAVPRSKYFALYTTAKRLAWDPAAVDLSADADSWQAIRRDHGDERAAEQILRLCNLFLAGERSVTDTLAPFCGAVPRAGLPVDMELHLAAQLLEEAKHWEFFDRYFAEVLGDDARAAATLAAPSQAVLVDDLAAASDRLRREDDPARLRALLVEGITHYMGVVEAMLARTGYEGAHTALARRGWLPGLREGFRLIRRDEGRHVAFGIHAVRDLVAAEPPLAAAVERTFERHLPNVLATVQQFAGFERPLVDVAHLTGFAVAACRQFLAAAGLGDVDAGEAQALEAELAGSE